MNELVRNQQIVATARPRSKESLLVVPPVVLKLTPDLSRGGDVSRVETDSMYLVDGPGDGKIAKPYVAHAIINELSDSSNLPVSGTDFAAIDLSGQTLRLRARGQTACAMYSADTGRIVTLYDGYTSAVPSVNRQTELPSGKYLFVMMTKGMKGILSVGSFWETEIKEGQLVMELLDNASKNTKMPDFDAAIKRLGEFVRQSGELATAMSKMTSKVARVRQIYHAGKLGKLIENDGTLIVAQRVIR